MHLQHNFCGGLTATTQIITAFNFKYPSCGLPPRWTVTFYAGLFTGRENRSTFSRTWWQYFLTHTINTIKWPHFHRHSCNKFVFVPLNAPNLGLTSTHSWHHMYNGLTLQNDLIHTKPMQAYKCPLSSYVLFSPCCHPLQGLYMA